MALHIERHQNLMNVSSSSPDSVALSEARSEEVSTVRVERSTGVIKPGQVVPISFEATAAGHVTAVVAGADLVLERLITGTASISAADLATRLPAQYEAAHWVTAYVRNVTDRPLKIGKAYVHFSTLEMVSGIAPGMSGPRDTSRSAAGARPGSSSSLGNAANPDGDLGGDCEVGVPFETRQIERLLTALTTDRRHSLGALHAVLRYKMQEAVKRARAGIPPVAPPNGRIVVLTVRQIQTLHRYLMKGGRPLGVIREGICDALGSVQHIDVDPKVSVSIVVPEVLVSKQDAAEIAVDILSDVPPPTAGSGIERRAAINEAWRIGSLLLALGSRLGQEGLPTREINMMIEVLMADLKERWKLEEVFTDEGLHAGFAEGAVIGAAIDGDSDLDSFKRGYRAGRLWQSHNPGSPIEPLPELDEPEGARDVNGSTP